MEIKQRSVNITEESSDLWGRYHSYVIKVQLDDGKTVEVTGGMEPGLTANVLKGVKLNDMTIAGPRINAEAMRMLIQADTIYNEGPNHPEYNDDITAMKPLAQKVENFAKKQLGF